MLGPVRKTQSVHERGLQKLGKSVFTTAKLVGSFQKFVWDPCKACRRLAEVRTVCFDYRKVYMRLAEVWTVGLTTSKRVGGLMKFVGFVFGYCKACRSVAQVGRVRFDHRKVFMRHSFGKYILTTSKHVGCLMKF